MFTTVASSSSLNASELGGAKSEEGNNNSTAQVFDPAFGIRISNPKVPLDTIDNFCVGMRKIRLSHLTPSRVKTQQEGGEEWLTMGVMVERSGCKKSANGNEFMIWRLSDLTELNATAVKVLLFGDCVKEYWKLQLGNTIMLSNPNFAEQSTPTTANGGGGTRANEVTLKVSKLGQVIELGFCPDFGQCQGTKASSGEQCSHFVNNSRSLYCPFHIQQRARQLAANRGTLNRSGNLPPRAVLRPFQEPPSAAMARGRREEEMATPPGLVTLSRNQSRGGTDTGKTFTKPFGMLQRGLNHRKSADNAALEAAELAKRSQAMAKLIEENPDHLGSKNLRLMRLNRENAGSLKGRRVSKPASPAAAEKPLNSMRDFIKSQVFQKRPAMRDGTNDIPTISTQNQQVQLATASAALSMSPSSSSEQRERMKIKRAAEVLKNSAKKPKLSKRDSNAQEQNAGDAKTSAEASRGGSLLGASFTDEQIQALLGKRSTHEAEATEEELDRQNAYFDRRAVEEQVETNATSLMEIKDCKVVTCEKCDYTSQHQSAYCKKQGHQIRRHLADKRFFKCTNCKRRLVSYERIVPSKPCLGCKCTNFYRVAMRDERKVELEHEVLKIKEQEKNFASTEN